MSPHAHTSEMVVPTLLQPSPHLRIVDSTISPNRKPAPALLLPKKYDKTVAREILKFSSNNLHELGKFSMRQLLKIDGMTKAAAAIIVATVEIQRRRQSGGSIIRGVATDVRTVAGYLRPSIADYPYEVLEYCFSMLWIRS